MSAIAPCPVTSAPAPQAPAPDYAAIKTRQQATWASGDYSVIAATLPIVAEDLCEAVDLAAGEEVLDVAAGTANAAIAAARRFCRVTATDYVPALLERGRRRAAAEGLELDFREADVENLPYADESFDVTLSTFGVMFAPNHARSAAEMLRVTRPGGRIGLANWTPEGFIGQLFKVIGGFVPPPAGLSSPALWGTETRLVELFGPEAADIQVNRRHFNFRYRSAEHWIDIFRNYYGPTLKAFAALEEDRRPALHAALLELLARFNRAGAGSLVVPGEYLEVVVTKRH